MPNRLISPNRATIELETFTLYIISLNRSSGRLTIDPDEEEKRKERLDECILEGTKRTIVRRLSKFNRTKSAV